MNYLLMALGFGLIAIGYYDDYSSRGSQIMMMCVGTMILTLQMNLRYTVAPLFREIECLGQITEEQRP